MESKWFCNHCGGEIKETKEVFLVRAGNKIVKVHKHCWSNVWFGGQMSMHNVRLVLAEADAGTKFEEEAA